MNEAAVVPMPGGVSSRSGQGGGPNGGASARRPDSNWPTLHDAALCGVAGEIVKAITRHTEADKVALLVHLLAEYSCIIGREPFVELDSVQSPLLFWPVCVGDTSKSRKGTASKRIQKVFKDAIPSWTRGECRGNLSSGEGLVWAVRDEDPEPGGLGVRDKRLFLIEAEFGSMLKVMGREGNSLSGVVRDAWDGLDLAPLTKGSRIRATAPCIGIVGHVTKEELLQNLKTTEASNGFGNRFVWFAVRRARVLPFGGKPNQARMEPLIQALGEAVSFGRGVAEIGMTEEAARDWEAVYPQLSEGHPGIQGALLGRAEAQVRRTAALYALLDQQTAVARDHLKAALALWEYAEDSVYWTFGLATGDSVADKILREVDGAGELTDSEISDRFNRNVSAARLNQAKERLERAGVLHSVILSGTGGRNQRVWKPGRRPRP